MVAYKAAVSEYDTVLKPTYDDKVAFLDRVRLTVVGSLGYEHHLYGYDAQGRLIVQQTFDTNRTVKSLTYNEQFDDAGHVVAYRTETTVGDHVRNTYTNSYRTLSGGVVLSSTVGRMTVLTGTLSGRTGADATSTMVYDANGILTGINYQAAGDAPKSGTSRKIFIVDAQGKILLSHEESYNSPTSEQHQIIVNGELLLRYSTYYGAFNGLDASQQNTFWKMYDNNAYQSLLAPGGAAVDAGTGATTGQVVIAEEGDTLRTLALRVYGDADAWYRLAGANNLEMDSVLTAGQTVLAPAAASDSYRLSFDNEKLIGSTAPNLPPPPPPEGGRRSCMSMVIVAICIITGAYLAKSASVQALAAPTGGSGASGTGTEAKTGYQKGVVSSGLQEEIQWKSVGFGARSRERYSPRLTGNARLDDAGNRGQGTSVQLRMQERVNWTGVAGTASDPGGAQLGSEWLGRGTLTVDLNHWRDHSRFGPGSAVGVSEPEDYSPPDSYEASWMSYDEEAPPMVNLLGGDNWGREAMYYGSSGRNYVPLSERYNGGGGNTGYARMTDDPFFNDVSSSAFGGFSESSVSPLDRLSNDAAGFDIASAYHLDTPDSVKSMSDFNIGKASGADDWAAPMGAAFAFGNTLGSGIAGAMNSPSKELPDSPQWLLDQLTTNERFAALSPQENSSDQWNGDGETRSDATPVPQVVVTAKRLTWYEKAWGYVTDAADSVGDFFAKALTSDSQKNPVPDHGFAIATAALRERNRQKAQSGPPQSYVYALDAKNRYPNRANSVEQRAAQGANDLVSVGAQASSEIGAGTRQVVNGNVVEGGLRIAGGALTFAPGLPLGKAANLFRSEQAVLGNELNQLIKNANLSTGTSIGGLSPVRAGSGVEVPGWSMSKNGAYNQRYGAAKLDADFGLNISYDASSRSLLGANSAREIAVPDPLAGLDFLTRTRVERFAESVNSNAPWKWRDIDPSIGKADRAIIRQHAYDAGLVPQIPVDPTTRFADFSSVLIKAEDLPSYLWGATDRAQFKYLDDLIGGRPVGTTWHHHELPGRAELVPFGIHNITSHSGGRTTWSLGPR